MKNSPKIAAIVVAGGVSSRFGGKLPKLYQLLGGKAVVERSVELFTCHGAIGQVVVVYHPDHALLLKEALQDLSVKTVVGGNSRAASVLAGLRALEQDAPEYVLVHDAARPLCDAILIDRIIEAMLHYKAAIPVVEMVDTIKQCHEHKVKQTIPRHDLRYVQTPQGFDFKTLLKAYNTCNKNLEQFTDEASCYEFLGYDVHTVTGDKKNLKLTTQDDLDVMEYLLTKNHKNEGSAMEFRTGSGFDVHALVDKDQTQPKPLMLCGVEVESKKTLQGHSDADVGLHALTDALLGAVAAGDIGEHFPPSDNTFKGMDSSVFLKKAKEIIEQKQGAIIHVDVTLICETPKISPYKKIMQQRIASLLDITDDRVSVKATTTEKLGFLGRQEGIAAQAVVTVKIYPS